MTGKWIAERWGWFLLLILLTAAALRFPALDQIPPGFQFDEAYNAIDALRVMQGDRPLFLPANGGREVIYTYLQALAMYVLGVQITSLRFTSALIGVLGIAGTFFLVRMMWQDPIDRRSSGLPQELAHSPYSLIRSDSTLLAFLSISIMSITYWHLHFSRYGIRAITLILLEVLLFYAFWRGLRSHSLSWWVASGVLLGLGPYTHPAGRFLPFIITAFVIYKLISHRKPAKEAWIHSLFRSPILQQWLTMAVIAIIIFIPLGWYFWHNHEAFSGHADLVSIFNPEVNDGSPIGAFMRNLWAVAGMFLLHGDGAWNHNLSGRPVWGPFMASLFLLGAGILIDRVFRRSAPEMTDEQDETDYSESLSSATEGSKDRESQKAQARLAQSREVDESSRDKYIFWAIWLVVMLMPTLLSSGAPDFSRSIGTVPALCLLPGLSLFAIAGRLPPKRWYVTAFLVAVVLLTTTYETVRDYFVVFPREPDLYHLYDVDKLEVAEYLRDWAAEDQVYLSPLWFEHATVSFLTQGLGLKSFDAGETLVLPSRAEGKDAVYVFSWEQTPYIDSFAERMGPLAEQIDAPNHRGGKLLTTFRVPADRLPDPTRPLQSLTEAGFPLAPEVYLSGCDDSADCPPPKFGGEIALLGYDLPDVIPAGGAGPVTLYWQALKDLDEDYTVFLHVADERGRRWGQDDRRPNQGGYPTPVWETGDVIIDRYWPAIDPCAPANEMRVTAGLYLYATGERLTVDTTGLDAASLGRVEIVPPKKLTLRDRKPARELDREWDGLRLLGIDSLPDVVASGDILPVNLYWRALADLEVDYELELAPTLVGTRGAQREALPRLNLHKDESVCTHHDLTVPSETASGAYTLTLNIPALNAQAELGVVQVERLPRSFTLPEHLGHSRLSPRLDAQFGDHIHLRGYELSADALARIEHFREGEIGHIPLTLYWQADGPVAADYTVFVHLLDGAGALRSQYDAAPAQGARPTSSWLPGEVISDTVSVPLPADLPPGVHRIILGMYSSHDGQRLPVVSSELDDAQNEGKYLLLDVPVEVEP